MTLTNVTNISLPLAVWLATDSYDFIPGDKSISATSLLKSTRQIILGERMKTVATDPLDVSDLIASRLGHTIHDGIERAWSDNYQDSMRKLGYPDKLIERIAINPDESEVTNHMLPIWIEQRTKRSILGYEISGKFDLVLEGTLHDYKSTTTYSWTAGSRDDDFRLQGSIYRWLNPTKITEDHMYIQFIFTDWQRFRAKQDPNYPQQRVLEHRLELLSLSETEKWIKAKLRSLEINKDIPEESLPFCTKEELWMTEPTYKYYSNPAKTDGRSTKNFDDLGKANTFMAEKGGKGVIITVPGKAKACAYCFVAPICTQKDLYSHD